MKDRAADPPSAGRVNGLDAWRVLLMLGGLLLHGSIWQQPLPLFEVIALVSHSFRMGSFFAISGFLCGMSLLKRSPREWLARRAVQIGLPTLFGLAVICPLIGLIIGLRPIEAHGVAPLPFDWYHLWFLVALLLYSPAAVLVHQLDARFALAGRIAAGFGAGGRSLLPLMLTVSAASFTLMVAAAMLVEAMAPPAYFGTLSECRMIAGYLPLYLLGFALARSQALRRAALASWRSPLGVVAATIVLYLGWYQLVAPRLPASDRAWADQLVQLVGAALCPPAVFLLIFRSAVAVRRTPPMLARLCDASLTIYLVHLPLMVAINLMFATIAWNPYAEFAVAVGAGGLLSYAFHVWVVRPVPWLSLLINGRSDALPRPASVDEARHHLAIGAADLHLRA